MLLFKNLQEAEAAGAYVQGQLPAEELLITADEPFLPEGVYSIYEYYLMACCGMEHEREDFYYPFMELPEDWQVHGLPWKDAIIRDAMRTRGEVILREPKREGYVDRIEWKLEGRVIRRDHYNSYGYAYRREFSTGEGEEALVSYYTPWGYEWLLFNKTNGTVLLIGDGHVAHSFASLESLEAFLVGSIGGVVELTDRRA